MDPLHRTLSNASKGSKRKSASGSFVGDVLIDSILPTLGFPAASANPGTIDDSPLSSLPPPITPGKPALDLVCAHPVKVTFKNLCVDVRASQSQDGAGFRAFFGLGGGARGRANEMKRILNGVSGTLRPGKMVAVMGASGSGKSTLLNVLSRRVLPAEGYVTMNGAPQTDELTKTFCAFVQQLDMFLKCLTVDEHMTSQTGLRLPKSALGVRKARKELILENIQLTKCRNTVIGEAGHMGGLSGGEAKRLNIASELLTLPPVIFADEPTTGLDSFMATKVVSTLKESALSGRTVIATIHQPSSRIYDMFDELLLVAEGRCVYFGERMGAVEWFKDQGFECPISSNPAEYFLKVLSLPEQPELRASKLEVISRIADNWATKCDAWNREWRTSRRSIFIQKTESFSNSASRAMSVELGAGTSEIIADSKIVIDDIEIEEDAAAIVPLSRKERKLGWFRQFIILYKRASQANKRDPQLVHARAIQTLVLGLVFGFLFFRLEWDLPDSATRIGGINTGIMNQAMAGTFSVISTFIPEKPIIRREIESGLVYPSAYIASKMLADAPVQIIFPLIFGTIVFWMMNLASDFYRYVLYLVLTLLVANCAMSIGYFASAMVNNMEIAAVICNMTLMPFVIFNGFLVKLSDAPAALSWIQWISFFRYGFHACLVTIYRNQTIYVDDSNTIDGIDFIEDRLGFTTHLYGFCFVMLVVVLLAFRLTSCLAFVRSTKRKENALD